MVDTSAAASERDATAATLFGLPTQGEPQPCQMGYKRKKCTTLLPLRSQTAAYFIQNAEVWRMQSSAAAEHAYRPLTLKYCTSSGLTTDPETPKGQQKHLKGVYVMSKLGQAPAAPQKSRFATREQVRHSMMSLAFSADCKPAGA